MRKSAFLFLSLAFLAAFSLSAQQTLTPSASYPVPDGVVGAGEYQVSADVSGMTIGATLGTDGKLYLSVRAPTSGWVALGLGNGRMDGSRLFLAYDSGGKQDFAEQLGAGHSHRDVIDPEVEKWAVKSEGGYTSLELVIPASAGVANGKVGILYAYSDSTSYSSRHKARGFMSLAVGG